MASLKPRQEGSGCRGSRVLAELARPIRQHSRAERNDDYLQAGYFDVLRSNGAAHTLTSWSRMPSLREQLLIDDVLTASHTAARALLRPGRVYEEAVKLFSPYGEVKEAYPSGRDALPELISRSRREKRTAYIHINNRFEGNAIGTIEGILEG